MLDGGRRISSPMVMYGEVVRVGRWDRPSAGSNFGVVRVNTADAALGSDWDIAWIVIPPGRGNGLLYLHTVIEQLVVASIISVMIITVG